MPKILVADDNTNIQKMVALAFEERGIDVVSVGNGEAAVRRIPDMNPDLVLADIFMPVRNGYEVCEFVKKDSRFSHVPVILLVGAFDPLDEKEARRVGADGVLKKPFVPPDPLIAMVISALEKNPKLAAEIARARDAALAPPSAAAAEPLSAALEAPARAEVKPLPSFPEPSAEEAALVYGFGAGKRGKEDPVEADKGPISLDVEDVEDDDADQTGSSGGDWRRSAMDFEIPEETSKTTAFALDDDTAAAMFPSERDVPPKRVSAKGGSKFGGVDAIELASAPFAPPAPAAPPVATTPTPPVTPVPKIEVPPSSATASSAAPSDGSFTATAWGTMPGMASSDASAPVVEAELPAMKISGAPEAAAPIALEDAKPAESPVVAAKTDGVIAEAETVIESSSGSRATHWMDAMKAAMKPSRAEDDAKAEAQEPAPPATTAEVAPPPVAKAEPAAAPEELAVMAEPLEPELEAELQPEDESFFADDSQESASQESSGWIAVESADAKKADPANDPALEMSGPVAVGHVAVDPELMAEDDTSGPIAKDPALVEPPSVKVTPEPLLVDDAAVAEKSGYEKSPEATAAPFEFADEMEVPAGAPAEEEAVAPANAAPAIDERVPTGPPPNREALAEIPFLTPPPEFLAANSAANAAKSDDQDVDALVRKVMEKLEPQLHNLLSQGVLKPLVENILHSDLSKKER